jgi:SAM-dependent methyltransferase
MLAEGSKVMPQRGTKTSYRWLALHYDKIFSSHRSHIDKARGILLRGILPHVKTACDLACGTGITALSLAQRGVKVFAVDLSPAMCRIAREKSRRARLDLSVICADMRAFRLPEQVDLITCESDALNHVSRRSDLRRVALAVSRALRPGGYFLFDVNSAFGFERYWTGNVWIEKSGVVMVMRNSHKSGSNRASSDLEIFTRDGDCWYRHHEKVEEVCWDSEEIETAFRTAGFDRIRAWDAAPFFGRNSLVTPGCHTFYLLRKSLPRKLRMFQPGGSA